jgi:hypothetical protein
MNFITDKAAMEKSLVDVGYDIKKLPLNKLSKDTFNQAYKVLEDIQKVLTPTK